MLWKVYLWILLLFALLGTVDLLTSPTNFLKVAYLLNFYVAVYALYSFIYKKRFFPSAFWKFSFWFNVLLDIAYFLVKSFPTVKPIDLLSFLSESPDPAPLLVNVLLSFLDIPILYAVYQLSRGKFLKTEKK